MTCDSDDMDKVEVSTELTEEQIPALQVGTAPLHRKRHPPAANSYLSYYMYLNIDLLTHHTHFTHPAPTLSVPVCLSLHFVSAVTKYVCLSTPSSTITQSLASRVTLERDVDDYQLVKDSKENKEGQSAMLGARYIQGPGNQLSSVLSHRPDKPGNTWLTYNG